MSIQKASDRVRSENSEGDFDKSSIIFRPTTITQHEDFYQHCSQSVFIQCTCMQLATAKKRQTRFVGSADVYFVLHLTAKNNVAVSAPAPNTAFAYQPGFGLGYVQFDSDLDKTNVK